MGRLLTSVIQKTNRVIQPEVCVSVLRFAGASFLSFFLFSKETQKYPHDMRSILGLFVGGGFLTVVVGCGCCSR